MYRILIAQTRSAQGSLQIPIRCDSFDFRRQIMMDLKSVGDGHIEFLCRTLKVEAREPVDLLPNGPARSDRIIRICSF